MSGTVVFLLILILAGGFGVFALARLALRRLIPLKPRAAVFGALGAGLVFAAAMTFAAADVMSDAREGAFSQGYDEALREADGLRAQERSEAYAEAYTKGYTDAVDGYLSELFAQERAVPSGSASDAREDVPASLPEEEEGGLLVIDALPEGEESGERALADGEEEPEKREPTGTIVYYTPSGSVLHRDPNCSYLKNASQVLSCDLADAPDRKPCSRCG